MRTKHPSPAHENGLYCAVCGVLVAPDDQHGVESVKLDGVEPEDQQESKRASLRGWYTPVPFEVTRCGECAARRQQAEDAVQVHGVVTVGMYQYAGSTAVEQVEAALVAAAASGLTVPVDTRRHLTLAVKHLSSTVRGVQFRDHLAREPRRASRLADRLAWINADAEPWAYVTPEQIAVMQQAFVRLAAERVEQPEPIKPDHSEACWVCGVGSITAMPSTEGVWHTAKVDPASFGGSGQRLEVEVCGPCWDAQQRVGSWGCTLVDTLVLDAAGVGGQRLSYDLQVTAPAVWGLTGRHRANTKPWQHLDLAGLAKSVREGVRAGEFS